jgi:DNA-directed RNA polymerase subunit M/transcription elongation factor TFIIS
MKYVCNRCGQTHDSRQIKRYLVASKNPKKPRVPVCESCLKKQTKNIKKAAKKIIPDIKLGI